MRDTPDVDAPAPGTLGAVLPRRRRRLLLGVLMLSLAGYLLVASTQFRSVDDVNLFNTAHSLVYLQPSIDVCTRALQSADFLNTGGSHGCVDGAHPNQQTSYQEAPDGKLVSKYGVGEPLAASPLFAAGSIVGSVLSDSPVGACRGTSAISCCGRLTGNADQFMANCQGDTRDMIVQTTTLFTNSFLTALTLALVIVVSLQLGAALRSALLIGFAFGFGSYAFAYAKTMSTEPGTALFLIAAVVLAIEASRTQRPQALVGCGVAAGAALLFRNTAAVFLPVLGLWLVVLAYRRSDARTAAREGGLFALGAAASLFVLAMFNAWRYGNPLSLGYGQTTSHVQLKALRHGGSVITGLWGQWLSPGKSIFLYAPFVLLAVAGIVISFRRRPAETTLLAALVAVNTLLFARVRFWSGDWAWGPRYMIIVLPCLAALCAPLVDRIRWRRALAVLAGLGFVFPGMLGVTVNFNTYYRQLNAKYGPGFLTKVWHNFSFQPIRHSVGILGTELRNLGKPFGLLYMTGRPRLDIWWLDDRWWLTHHPNRMAAALLMLAIIAALAIGGIVLIRRTLRTPAPAAPPPRGSAARASSPRARAPAMRAADLPMAGG